MSEPLAIDVPHGLEPVADIGTRQPKRGARFCQKRVLLLTVLEIRIPLVVKEGPIMKPVDEEVFLVPRQDWSSHCYCDDAGGLGLGGGLCCWILLVLQSLRGSHLDPG